MKLYRDAALITCSLPLVRIAFMMSLAAGTLFFTGCPKPDWPTCKSDKDCIENGDGREVNYHCVFDRCQECGRDNQCDIDERCVKNMCAKSCSTDSDCEDHERCGLAGVCESGSRKDKIAAIGEACDEKIPCAPGLLCKNNVCVSTIQDAAPKSATATVTEVCPEHSVLTFDYNADTLAEDTRSELKQWARCASQEADTLIRIEGHADERGTTMYNLDLGDRRANAVRSFLVDLGVDGIRLRALSYGEERPANLSRSESGFAENRRVELFWQAK